MIRMRLARLSICSAVFISVVGSAYPHTISGSVLDSSDKSIAGVRVEAYRQGRLLDYSVSDENGRYSISFSSGAPIDTVRFDHSDWFPGAVEDISGSNDHNLFKTLYKRGASLTYLEVQEVVSSFERLQELDQINDSSVGNLKDYRYEAALQEIENMIDELKISPDVKTELKVRIALIKRKYGIF